MTATIKNLFTRTQFILLASLLALVFLSAPSVQASEKVVQGESFASSVAGLASYDYVIPKDIKASVRYKVSTRADVLNFPIDSSAQFTIEPLISYYSSSAKGTSGDYLFKADDARCGSVSEKKCAVSFGKLAGNNLGEKGFRLELTNSKSAIKFTSSDPSILSCTKNVCTGKKAGKAVVTVTIPDYTAQVIGTDDQSYGMAVRTKPVETVKKNFTMPGATFTWNVTVGGDQWGLGASYSSIYWSDQPGADRYEVYFDHAKSPSKKKPDYASIDHGLKRGQHSAHVVAIGGEWEDNYGNVIAGKELSRSNEFVFYVTASKKDTTWPKPKEIIIPKGLESYSSIGLTLEALANGSVQLKFSECGDGQKGSYCKIFKDGKLYKTLTGGSFESYVVDGTPLNTEHSFAVASFYDVENLKKSLKGYNFDVSNIKNAVYYSPSLSITTGKKAIPPKDVVAPIVPKNFRVTAKTTSSVTFGWTASTDAGGIKGYNIYWDTDPSPINEYGLIAGTSFTEEDSERITENPQAYTIEAVDATGNKSAKVTLAGGAPGTVVVAPTPTPVTCQAVGCTTDKTAPTIPTNFKATGDSSSQVTLTWTASTDAGSGVKGYRIGRSDLGTNLLGEVTATTKYVDTTVKPSTSYTYTIQAIDNAKEGNLSAKASVTMKTASAPAPVTTPSPTPTPVPTPTLTRDTTAPTIPGTFKATANSATQVTLTWTASTDAGGIKGYNVYRNGVTAPLNATPQTTLNYTNTGLTPSTAYTYTVEAVDMAGNKSTKASVSVTTPAASVVADTVAPSVPSNFRVTASTTSSITLAWNASTDATGITGYNIYRDTNIIPRNATVVTGTTFTDAGLTQGTSYTYSIEAIDSAPNKNRSTKATVTTKTPSTAVAAPTPDTTAPTVPGALKAVANSGTQVTLTWTASTDAGGIKGYNVYRNGVTAPLNATPQTTLNYTNTGLTPSTAYTYTVEAVDMAGNKSTKASSAVTTPAALDTTVPTVPSSATVANLTAVSGSGWSVALSWGASTDNVGVTGYIVKNIAPTAGALTTTTGKTYTLTGLLLGSEYTVSIQAKDARGNLGPARVVKFKPTFTSMASPPTIQIISNTVDTAVQKVVAQAPSSVPLTSAEQTTKIETLTSLMNKLIELQAMLASVKGSR